MTDTLDVPLGTPSKLAYLIRLDEDAWLKLVKEGWQDTCYQVWRDEAQRWKADPKHDIRVVCLQLIPDPLFPSTERTAPYVHWQEPVLGEGEHTHAWVDTQQGVYLDGGWLITGEGKVCTVCHEFRLHKK